MRLVDVHARLLRMGVPVFQTSDAAAYLGVGSAHASKLLARLAVSGHLARLGRGRWGFKERIDPFALPEYLTAPYPSYVSLQSALYHHGLISQIPSVIYAVSIARTKVYVTSLGTVSVHHIDPSFFFGHQSAAKRPIKIATPEKALIDFLYLGPARTRLFRALPELEFSKGFKVNEARKIIGKIRPVRRRNHVSRLFEEIWKSHTRA
ncbi:MAG: type IV toxin-antitoxin system AbiEi family antitoxin domain-containing protein [Candidatus Aminicenantes bacterium]|nr:type IV toxin-antitoxin system AbiEi family antitoxin domain-containing protein [Candidatus Aminicenantes bacterium]MCJ7486741.1 type IV toxin-antitoxin system AbiEi family antitoxin domain-containing protein [Candidatus Aminicenantes bacterium]